MNKLFFLAMFVSFVAAAIIVWKLIASGTSPLPLANSQTVPASASSAQMMQILGATTDDGGKSDMTRLDQEVKQLD